MKLITYNVNGIRSAMEKQFVEWLAASQADVICLQEIKALIQQIDTSVFTNLGYEIFWFPAQKKGYSGTAILSKVKPKNVVYGIGLATHDFEGRQVRIDFDDFSVMSIYAPSGSSGDERQGFKFEWLEDFYYYIQNLQIQIPNLVIGGDFNICHQEIDIHNPKANKHTSGFTPEERNWLSEFLNLGFIDTFRYFNPNPHHYTWWSYRAGARKKNLGWRIDYWFASQSLASRLKRSMILSEAYHSDHCPVLLEII